MVVRWRLGNVSAVRLIGVFSKEILQFAECFVGCFFGEVVPARQCAPADIQCPFTPRLQDIVVPLHRCFATPEELPTYFDMGFRFLACGSDAGFVTGGARSTVSALRNMMKGRGSS